MILKEIAPPFDASCGVPSLSTVYNVASLDGESSTTRSSTMSGVFGLCTVLVSIALCFTVLPRIRSYR